MKTDKTSCKAIAKSGKPCKAAPTASGFCFFHGNPNMASQLGRIGGKKNRPERHPSVNLPPKLDGLRSVLERTEYIFDETRAGSMSPAVAHALLKTTDLQTRVLEKTRLEQQIADLQQQMNDLKSMMNIRDLTDDISEAESSISEDDIDYSTSEHESDDSMSVDESDDDSSAH